MYEDSGATLLYEGIVAAQGTCNGKDCWKATGSSGYKFKDKSGAQDSISDIKLKSGINGKAQVQVKGRGAGLAPLVPPFNLDVKVQLISGDGVSNFCWETDFSVPTKNESGQFKAKGP